MIIAVMALQFPFASCSERDQLNSVIVFEPVLELDLRAAPSLPREGAQVAVPADRSVYVVLPGVGDSELLVFNADGSFRSVIGREGAGPGEYRGIRAIVFDSENTLWVFDGRNGRVDLRDAEFNIQGTLPFTARLHSAKPLMDRPGVILNAPFRGAGMAGQRARLLLPDGSERPLAAESQPLVANDIGTAMRAILPVGQDRFWVANFHEYDLRLLTYDDDTLEHIRTQPEWWRNRELPDRVAGYFDSGPAILDIGVDREGLLWVHAGALVASTEDLVAVVESGSTPDQGSLVDHHVEVIDPVTGDLVAQERYDHWPIKFLGRGTAYMVDMTNDMPRVVIYNFGLQRHATE